MHAEEGPVAAREVGGDDGRRDAFGPLEGDDGLALLTAALAELPDATLLVFDRALRYRLVRGGALPGRGFSASALEGQLACDALGPERWSLYESPYRAALDGGRSTFEVPSPDGTRTFSIHVAPLHGRTGEIIGGVSIAVDITERVDGTTALARSEERFRRAMHDAPIAMAIVSPDGRFLDVNPAVCRFFERDRDELLLMGWPELTHPDDLQMSLDVAADARARGLDGYTFRKRFLDPDGRVLTADVSASIIRDADGAPLLQISQLVDVTEQVRIEEELRASEAHFRLLAEHASDVVLLVADGGPVSWVSPSVERLLGWAPDDLIGTNSNRLISPLDLDAVRQAVAGLERADGPVELECRVEGADGRERWMAVRISGPSGDDTVRSFVVALRDIGDEVEARAERDRREADLVRMLDSSPDAILRVGADLRINFVNEVMKVAFPEVEWAGKGLRDLGLPDELIEAWDDKLRLALRSATAQAFEIQGRAELGSPWWDARITPSFGSDGAVTDLTVTLRDITTRKGAERELFMAATHDPLTGLANRAEVLSEIERALSAATRSTHSTAVLMLDLDHFKLVNDSLGHAVGDKLLLAAAQRLSALVRSGDMAGRLGGDEFVVVMRDLDDPTEAARIGERVVNAFREPLAVGELALLTTASVGLTVAGPLGPVAPAAASLLREADTALYRAKGSGRDALAFFSEGLRAEVAERLLIEEALRHALARDELELWYQPEVGLVSGRVEAVEALLRWRHPSGEIYAADRFIAIAEDTGLIVEIGDWVIHQACAEAARWSALRPDDPLTVRINLSAAQLSEVGLVDELRRAIDACGVDPAVLCLEVTEAALLHDLPTAQEKLQAIRQLGIGVAVDAFGTGDSSIRCLRECEIDVLKIDASLAADLGDADDRRLLAGVLALAQTLGLPVTAKGIETTGQAAALRSLGCGSAQGWLFSRAVEPGGIDALLEGGPAR